jgi:hypothetical protein
LRKQLGDFVLFNPLKVAATSEYIDVDPGDLSGFGN